MAIALALHHAVGLTPRHLRTFLHANTSQLRGVLWKWTTFFLLLLLGPPDVAMTMACRLIVSWLVWRIHLRHIHPLTVFSLSLSLSLTFFVVRQDTGTLRRCRGKESFSAYSTQPLGFLWPSPFSQVSLRKEKRKHTILKTNMREVHRRRVCVGWVSDPIWRNAPKLFHRHIDATRLITRCDVEGCIRVPWYAEARTSIRLRIITNSFISCLWRAGCVEREGRKKERESVYRDAFTRLIDVTTLVSWFARRMNMLVQACHTAFFVKKGQDKKLKPIYNVEFQEEIIFIDTSTEAYCCYFGLWIYSWSVFLVCPFILWEFWTPFLLSAGYLWVELKAFK